MIWRLIWRSELKSARRLLIDPKGIGCVFEVPHVILDVVYGSGTSASASNVFFSHNVYSLEKLSTFFEISVDPLFTLRKLYYLLHYAHICLYKVGGMLLL